MKGIAVLAALAWAGLGVAAALQALVALGAVLIAHDEVSGGRCDGDALFAARVVLTTSALPGILALFGARRRRWLQAVLSMWLALSLGVLGGATRVERELGAACGAR